jgi:hypothetical protein
VTITKSLAEVLMDAIVNGHVHGMQCARSFGTKPGDEKRCFDDLLAVIDGWEEAKKRVEREQAMRERSR